MLTLNGMFSKRKPHRVNFIKENKRKLRQISSMVNQNSSSGSRLDIAHSKGSQTKISRSISGCSSISSKEDKGLHFSNSRLGGKSSLAVFIQEKKANVNSSNVSITSKYKSHHKGMSTRNQSSQTVDPRKFDQLFHEGVIKYPSHKVLQQLADAERQKANRLDAHIRKEYLKRNKVKQKGTHKVIIPNEKNKIYEKGDEGDVKNTESEEEIEQENMKDEEPCQDQTKQCKTISLSSPSQPLKMHAADIIRQTSEYMNNSKKQFKLDHTPSSKGDAKPIKKLQKKLSKEEETDRLWDPNCPPGHIPLPDAERKKTLHMLRVSHAELIREMNLLPVRADTLRIRQKKIHLENQLIKIEEGIKVFIKSKVYVKIEE